MRISDWSSDVCSSDLGGTIARSGKSPVIFGRSADFAKAADKVIAHKRVRGGRMPPAPDYLLVPEEQEEAIAAWLWRAAMRPGDKEARSEEHTSELQSLMRISYAVFCLKKKQSK